LPRTRNDSVRAASFVSRFTHEAPPGYFWLCLTESTEPLFHVLRLIAVSLIPKKPFRRACDYES
jgi:hypothetical protein